MAIIILCIIAVVVGYEVLVKNNDKNECMVNISDNGEKEKVNDTIEVYVVGCVKKPDVYEVSRGTTVQKIVKKAGGFTEDADLEKINLVYKVKDNIMLEIKSKKASLKEEIENTEKVSLKEETENTKRTSSKGETENTKKDSSKEEIKNIKKTSSKEEIKNIKKTSSKEEIKNIKKEPPMEIIKGIYKEEDSKAEEELQININTAGIEGLLKLPGIGKAVAKKIIKYREENGDFESIEDIKNVQGIGENKFNNIKDMLTV